MAKGKWTVGVRGRKLGLFVLTPGAVASLAIALGVGFYLASAELAAREVGSAAASQAMRRAQKNAAFGSFNRSYEQHLRQQSERRNLDRVRGGGSGPRPM